MTAKGVFPENVRCPNKCSFCFEYSFSRLFPWIKTVRISPYTAEDFDLVFNNLKNKSLRPYLYYKRVDNQFFYYPKCDAFSLGFTTQQIETMLQAHKNSLEENDKLYATGFKLYTTGLNTDAEQIRYLISKYPIGIHFSIITFDPVIRSKIMNRKITLENIEKICKVLKRGSLVFLIYFNKEQIIFDLNELNRYSLKEDVNIYIHKLYYNQVDPQYLSDYSNKGKEDFKEIVYYLKNNIDVLKGRTLVFSPEPEIYAYKFRKEIKELLNTCKGESNEAIFCSGGACSIIKEHFQNEKINVVAMKTDFGGCINFTQGITIRNIISKIEDMKSNGITLKHIYLPSTIFSWIEDKYDMNGDNQELIKKHYPDIKVSIIDVPYRITNSVVNLEDCIGYYENCSGLH